MRKIMMKRNAKIRNKKITLYRKATFVSGFCLKILLKGEREKKWWHKRATLGFLRVLPFL